MKPKPKTKPTALRWFWDRYYIWILIWIMMHYLYFDGIKHYAVFSILILISNAIYAVMGHLLVYGEYLEKVRKDEIIPFKMSDLNLFKNKKRN